MNNVKITVIATILLIMGTPSYSMNLDEQTSNTEDIITESISSETPEEQVTPSEEATQPAVASAEAGWDNHLDALKEKDQYWNKNSNIPTNDWKEKAIELAKEALGKDKSIADALKSAFFNAMTEKIKIEEGEFTASTYALIKEFDDAIDAHVTKLKEAEEAKKEVEKKEEEPQPVESTPMPAETETPPAPVEEPKETQPETTTPPAPPAPDISQQWQDHLEKIATAGNSDAEQKNLLSTAYNLAKKLLSEGYTDESIFYGFESAIFRHNANPKLLHIRIDQAIEAFSAETGIPIPYNEQIQTQQYMDEMKKQAEQEIAKKQKNAATTIALLEKISGAPGSKTSELQEQVARLKQDLAAQHAADQAEMNARLAQMQKELVALRKAKGEKAPEEQGIFGKAVGAVKKWWYGEESQEQKDIKVHDEERFKKLQELLSAMKVKPQDKKEIEKNWLLFIEHLRSFKDLDTNDATATHTWLTTTEQALEQLTMTHHIISVKEATEIMKDGIKQYPDGTKFITEIKKYLEEKQRKIIEAKRQKETVILSKTQEKQQKIKNKIERKQTKQNVIDAYKNKEKEWQQLIAHIIQHNNAIDQDNINYTNEAIKIAEFLLHPIKPVTIENKNYLGQRLKSEFTAALVSQQKTKDAPEKYIYWKGIDLFNNAINGMT